MFTNNTSFTLTNSGTLDNGGTLKNFGTLNNEFGGTLINNGTLQLDSGSTFNNKGTLGGSGTVVGSVTTQAGSTIAPGQVNTNSPLDMTLTINGDMTFNATSTLQVRVDPLTTTASKLVVTGTANLDGKVLHVGNAANPATDFEVGKTYTILTANVISGKFTSASSDFAYLKADLHHDIKEVTLTLERNNVAFADLAQTGNQAAAANAVAGMSNTHGVYRYVQGLSAAGAPGAFAALSGDPHTNWQSGLQSLSARASGLGTQRMHSNLTAGYRPGAAIAQSGGTLPASAWPTSKALPAWAEVVGHRQSLNGDGNAAKLTQNVYGLFIGADEEVGSSGWRVGGSLGFTTADAKVKSRDASADTKSYSASVYTGKGFSHGANRVNVMGGLAYTHHRIDSQRSVAALSQNLKAKYNASTLQLFGEVGYAMGQYSKQGLEPFAGINISQQRVGSFQESGGFAALRGESRNDTTTSTTLGVRAHSDIKLAGKDVRLKGTVGWRHAWGGVKQTATLAFEGSNSFTVTGAPLARNTALLGLQAQMELSRRAALELGYQGEYGSGTRDNAVNVKVRWAY
ncbi:autotransporter outer membrane beta-barrel domain-containing protein [Comamonas sp. CMM02]|uniref:autotransporter family protein n=1 Tax=Comamonas sp. CMM02 TaxID=2769307 RepID=UPI001785335D